MQKDICKLTVWFLKQNQRGTKQGTKNKCCRNDQQTNI